MIIIGYQGIGKSTLAGKGKFIDLESGNFWVDGKRSDDWYIPYCNIAEHLSRQGFVVFTSSHEVVRKQLENSKEKVYVAYPSLNLKYDWIKKLEARYEDSRLEKDYKALMNAINCYEENIKSLMNSGFDTIEINDTSYVLERLIEKNCMNNVSKEYDSVDLVFENTDYVSLSTDNIVVEDRINECCIHIKNFIPYKYETDFREDLFERIDCKDITHICFNKNSKSLKTVYVTWSSSFSGFENKNQYNIYSKENNEMIIIIKK